MAKIETLLKNKNYRVRRGRGKLPKNPSIIRERLKPRLYDYTYIMTLSFRETFERMLELVGKKASPLKILDLGCGYKPYQAFFPNDQYIGVDLDLNSYADVIANNEQLPFKDNVFDVIILSEVLEHCDN